MAGTITSALCILVHLILTTTLSKVGITIIPIFIIAFKKWAANEEPVKEIEIRFTKYYEFCSC